MRLIFPETRHSGLQFEYKNETISIRIESDMIFWSYLYRLLQQLRKNRTCLALHSHQSFYLMHQISPKAKMRSKFMILCQPSLNGLSFIFSPPLLYKPPISFIPRHKKLSSLLFSWVLVKLSSLVISWSSWDSRYWMRLHSSSLSSSFPLPLGPLPRVSSFTVWILHECIIPFLYLFFVLPWWEFRIKAW